MTLFKNKTKYSLFYRLLFILLAMSYDIKRRLELKISDYFEVIKYKVVNELLKTSEYKREKFAIFLSKYIKPDCYSYSNGEIMSAGYFSYYPEYDYYAHVFPIRNKNLIYKFYPEFDPSKKETNELP